MYDHEEGSLALGSQDFNEDDDTVVTENQRIISSSRKRGHTAQAYGGGARRLRQVEHGVD